MREFAVIEAEQLNLHSAPGGKETQTGLVVYKGQRFEVVRTVDRPQALWAELYDGNYIALQNKVSKEKYARLEQKADPVITQPEPFDWKPYAVIGGLVAALLIAAYACSMNI